jgi:threo-3-hydroxy-L-aspartate ammonia-lyase
MITATLVSLEDIKAAADRVRGVARRTPLIPSARSGLLLKCENMQPMGAFKMRGAYNMVAQLAPDVRARGVITYSSGNHGQAVAMAAQLLGAPAVIVMPETAPAVKVAGARGYGAEVVFAGRTSFDRKHRAEQIAASRNLTIVPPFDHERIIAGQGTLGLEILEQCPDVRTVFVPVGGGGLISGVATAIKRSRADVRVIGVEPVGAPKMSKALAAGEPVTLDKTASIADGLLTMRAGDLTFAHAKAFVDEVVTVTDDEIAAAVKWLFATAKIVAEPSGAATTAAVLARAASDDVTVAVVSGGNVAPDDFARYIAG